MLNNTRALDLTDENGLLCGKILGDLGVDVIKIERPCGDKSRSTGPFWKDIPDPQKSLYWFAYNSNKRGITLDIETSDGKEIFTRLLKNTDFVLESFPPGYMKKLGLDYAALDDLKKGIILTSISPFGQEGPYRDYKTTEIVTMGMTGMLYQTGDIDRPPLQMSIPQTCMHAGADAAVGTLIAYYHREHTGEGQHIDVSMQQSTSWFLANAIPFWELSQIILKRSGLFRWYNASRQRQVWSCKDGYIFFFMLGGRTGAESFNKITTWMDSEGMAPDFMKTMDWETLDMGTANQELVDKITAPIEKFFLSHTKKEISDEATARQISLCPLASMEDLLANDQLAARNYWMEVAHPELNEKIIYPREFMKSTECDCSTRVRAPLIGEHNEEIYREIGLSDNDLVMLKQAGII